MMEILKSEKRGSHYDSPVSSADYITCDSAVSFVLSVSSGNWEVQ